MTSYDPNENQRKTAEQLAAQAAKIATDWIKRVIDNSNKPKTR